jgi:hypothetical protein
MAEHIEKGTWVQIHRIVLQEGQRAPQVPVETQQVPLEMWVKGFLAERATLGEKVEIVTPSGRRLRGILTDVNPGYTHSFGPPIPELLAIGREVRTILREPRGRG